MPVETPHRQYKDQIDDWEKVRDVVEGEGTIKKKGTEYLPKPSGMGSSEYNAYKIRAEFFGASSRTILGLNGAIMRRPISTVLPSQLEEIIKSIGIKSESLDVVAKETTEEALTTGKVGLYVDAPDDDPEANPYIASYFPENIINWKTEKINGRLQLTLVVLKEEVEHPGEDEFTPDVKTQYRVLKLMSPGSPVENANADDFTYIIEIWEENPDGADRVRQKFVPTQQFTPTRRGGGTFNYIPFVIVDLEKSPILDLANVNVSHYRTSADLEHGRHFTALPTPWVSGVEAQVASEQTREFRIGGETVWTLTDPRASAGYLEFTGAGLASLERAQKTKEERMAVLGARLLEVPRPGVETAEAVRLRQSGEGNVLQNVADAISEALTTCMKWLGDWIGISSETILVELNKDFNPGFIDSKILVGLMAALQSGAMSWESFHWNLSRGELIPPGVDPDEERELIKAGIPGQTLRTLGEDEDDEEEDEDAVVLKNITG